MSTSIQPTARISTRTGMPERITPLFNDCFVRIFGRDDSKAATKGLVNSILGLAGLDEIETIDAISAEVTDLGSSIDCRSARYDVRIVSANHILDLEAQKYNDNMSNKMLFYWAKLCASSTPQGTGFDEMPRITVITLLDTTPMFPDAESFVHTCNLAWDVDGAPQCATDRLTFVVVELAKVRKRYTSLDEAVLSDEALSWLYLLTSGFEKEAEVQALAETFPTLQEFSKLYGIAIDDPKIARAYDLAEECWREERARQRYLERLEREAVEQGLEKGMQQGMQQGLEQGLEQGMQQGMQQGLEQGTQQERERIEALLLSKGMSQSEIDELLNQE